MMILHHNIFALPFALVVSMIDLYFLFAILRLALARITSPAAQHVLRATQLTELLPQWVDRLLKAKDRPVASWVPWVLVVAGLVIIRHMLVLVILGLN